MAFLCSYTINYHCLFLYLLSRTIPHQLAVIFLVVMLILVVIVVAVTAALL